MTKSVLTDKRVIGQAIGIAIFFILLSIPCFGMTGKVLFPIVLSFSGSVVISALCSAVYRSEASLGLSHVFYYILLLIHVLVKEISLQAESGFVFEWIEFFYFDKLLVAGTVWLGSSLFVAVKRLASKESVGDYAVFFSLSSIAFIIFYSFLLLYSFVLIRLKSGDYPFRFIPFITIREYIDQVDEIPYEVFMMFFGNLLYFTPLGYIVSTLISDKSHTFKAIFTFVFPITAFTLLEFSQYMFQNGYCEFDDMLMNSLGFWIGSLMFFVANKIAIKISKGRFKRFWN